MLLKVRIIILSSVSMHDERDFIGMQEGEIILTDGFTLLDSMSAIEVSSSPVVRGCDAGGCCR